MVQGVHGLSPWKTIARIIHHFNMSPVNLTSLARGSVFKFRSENGEHQSVIIIFLHLIYLLIVLFLPSRTSGQLIIYRIMALDHGHGLRLYCGVALPAHVDPVQGFPLDARHISWDKLNESDIHKRFTKPSAELLNASDFSLLNASQFGWRTCEDNLTVKHASKKFDMRRKKKNKHSLWKNSYNFAGSSEIDSRKAFRIL